MLYADECIPDETAPFISIESPAAAGGQYNAEASSVSLAGKFSDDRGVVKVAWANDRGGAGTAQASIIDWNGPWSWEADDIQLEEGENIITVTAWDATGNSAAVSLTISYVPPPVSLEKNLENRKAKFTFFFVQDGIDRFSIYAYLEKDANEDFEMPFDKDVTVTVKVPDPRNLAEDLTLYTQTVPAGTVTGTTKYQYKARPGGIREMLFQKATSTQTYFYVYVENVDLLPDIKPTVSKTDYWAFTRNIVNYTLTVEIDGMVWTGQAPLVPGYYSEHKQELVYNR